MRASGPGPFLNRPCDGGRSGRMSHGISRIERRSDPRLGGKSWRARAALQRAVAAVPVTVEGLEGRVLLSAVVRSLAGANAAAISPTRGQFRTDLGGGT